ncbi:MAG: hypothetical protein WD032_02605 [Nitrospirales bacterium]
MNVQAMLQHPEAIRFPGNYPYKDQWDSAGGRVMELPSGHHVLYGRHNLRILLVDPSGAPLHECLWEEHPTGLPNLTSARIRLDWGQWVGIKPGGLVNTISLDLSKRSGWENLTRDDLRGMAARAMNADIGTIRFFYRDEDLKLADDGQATIRQVKDAFYVLLDGSFQEPRFMSCMSRMEWGRIDYLPVVELFLSLLPGTGSATFELIRGLYDDQQADPSTLLRYRGIPGYPSMGAFRLFSAFFSPSVESGEVPQDVFLDVNRSHQVAWQASPEYPVRHIDDEQRLSVTVHHHTIQKVTRWDDSTGLSYVPMTPSGEARADGRGSQVFGKELHLYDGNQKHVMKVRESWQVSSTDFRPDWKAPWISWRDCFPKGPPVLTPPQAFSAVLLYPDHAHIIGEKESQPFLFDYLDDFLEEQTELRQFREMADQVLFARCEAGLGPCLKYERPQWYTVWYEWPEFAQKQAQYLWNVLNRKNRLSWLPHFQFFPMSQREITHTSSPFDWMNVWIPFSIYDDHQELRQWSWFLANHLVPGGIGCVAGPEVMARFFQEHGLSVVHAEHGESLPTFKIHQAILQAGRLHPELMLWIIQQS